MDSEGKTNVVPPEKAEIQKIGPAGSTVAGTDFSIQPPAQASHSRIKSLKIQGGWAIDKIQVQYENLATHPPEIYNSLALGGPGGSASLFDLENDDYLVAVSGSWGAQASGYPKEEIITLQFNTHHGKQSQVFGGGNPQKQVEPFLFTAPAGYAIVGFFGASGSHQNCLVRLGVYLQPVQQEIRGAACPVLVFDGQDDYVELPPASIPSGSALTCSFWAYGGDALPTNNSVISAFDANGNRLLNIHLPLGDSAIYFDCGNSGSSFDRIEKQSQQQDYKGKWSHWAFTKDATAGEMRIYLNGELWHSGTGKVFAIPKAVNAQLGSYMGSLYYQGKLTQVQLWNRARTQAEIQQDMHRRLSGNEPGLVSYWSLNEGSGTLVSDRTSSTNHGTIHGATWATISDLSLSDVSSPQPAPATPEMSLQPTRQQADSGSQPVLMFDGQDDYLEIPNSKAINFTQNQDFAIEFWLKVGAISTQPETAFVGDVNIIEKWRGKGFPYAIRYSSMPGTVYASRYDGKNPTLTSQIAVNDQKFHHIAFVKQASQLFLYVDGTEQGKTVDTTTKTTQNNSSLYLAAGTSITQGGGQRRFFAGQLAELRLWNKARSQAEIQANQFCRLPGNEPGLVGYWAGDEKAGVIVNDKTPQGNHGTIHGATWATTSDFSLSAAQATPTTATSSQQPAPATPDVSSQQPAPATPDVSSQQPTQPALNQNTATQTTDASTQQQTQPAPNQNTALSNLPAKPNIVILLTDQEGDKVPEQWPEDFKDEHYPAMKRLKANGLTFNRMFTITAACSPSRGSLLTGTYPTEHGMNSTVAAPASIDSRYNEYGQTYAQHLLRPTQVTIAHVMKAAGYKVFWKGKWHLNHPIDGTDTWKEADIENMKKAYGFTGWNPLDAGVAREDLTRFGKGTFDNDERYLRGQVVSEKIQQQLTDEVNALRKYINDLKTKLESAKPEDINGIKADQKNCRKKLNQLGAVLEQLKALPQAEGILEFIQNYNPQDGPFCLIVSLVNPHDIHVAPQFEKGAGYNIDDFKDFNLPIPDSANEDMAYKPEIQEIFKEGCRVKDEARVQRMLAQDESLWHKDTLLNNPEVQQQFVNFYAYLKKLSDGRINEILEALEQKNLIDNTVIIRTSDHGEMCLNHGLREKAFNAYEETIRVPLIISNPKLFPTAQNASAFACSIDLMPTLAKIAGVYETFKFAFRGSDLTPVFTDPDAKVHRLNGEVRDSIHFTYDDGNIPDRFKLSPRRIRTIRTDEWKYSVYFNDDGSRFEYELYNLVHDPDENYNLAGGLPEQSIEALDKSINKLIGSLQQASKALKKLKKEDKEFEATQKTLYKCVSDLDRMQDRKSGIEKLKELEGKDKSFEETQRGLHEKLITAMQEMGTVPEPYTIYTEEMKKISYLPPLIWPTAQESVFSAQMHNQANEAEFKTHKNDIRSGADQVPAAMWWVGT